MWDTCLACWLGCHHSLYTFPHISTWLRNDLVSVIKFVCMLKFACVFDTHNLRRHFAVYHLTKLPVVNVCIIQVLLLPRRSRVPPAFTTYSLKWYSRETRTFTFIPHKIPKPNVQFWIYGLILYQILWHCI